MSDWMNETELKCVARPTTTKADGILGVCCVCEHSTNFAQFVSYHAHFSTVYFMNEKHTILSSRVLSLSSQTKFDFAPHSFECCRRNKTHFYDNDTNSISGKSDGEFSLSSLPVSSSCVIAIFFTARVFAADMSNQTLLTLFSFDFN